MKEPKPTDELVVVFEAIGIFFFLLFAFFWWSFVTPHNQSHDPEYRDIVGKQYRTKVPVAIFYGCLMSTASAHAHYDRGSYKVWPAGNLFYVRRIQSTMSAGNQEYLSIITSSGPYEGRKVDTVNLWITDVTVSSVTGRVSSEYVEEVPYDGGLK